MTENQQAEMAGAVDNAMKAERDSVAAWMRCHDVDPQSVATASESGETIFTNSDLCTDFSIKMADPNRAKAPTADATITEGEGGNDNLNTKAEVSEFEAANAKVLELSGVVNPKTV